MKNKFMYTNDNKRYHTFNYYLKNKYNRKVAKIPLDAGFTCPNRDGKKGYGGCIFCSARGSGEFTVKEPDLAHQYEISKKLIENKWPDAKHIAYFQAYTNTYGSLDKIKEMLKPFISNKDVVAIAIATRPDCLEQEKIDYLNSLCSHKEIWIELGLQTSNDNTAKKINRGHDFACLKDCLYRLQPTDIKTCIHIINGLIDETKEDMLQTIKDIKYLPFEAIKIHMLSITKDAPLKKLYLNKPFKLLTRDEYVDIVVEQLRHLSPEIIVQRLTGDPVKEELIEPKWLIKKTVVLNEIDKLMAKKDYYQGDLY